MDVARTSVWSALAFEHGVAANLRCAVHCVHNACMLWCRKCIPCAVFLYVLHLVASRWELCLLVSASRHLSQDIDTLMPVTRPRKSCADVGLRPV